MLSRAASGRTAGSVLGKHLFEKQFRRDTPDFFIRLLDNGDGWPDRIRKFEIVIANKRDRPGNGNVELMEYLEDVDRGAVFQSEERVRRITPGTQACDCIFCVLVVADRSIHDA